MLVKKLLDNGNDASNIIDGKQSSGTSIIPDTGKYIIQHNIVPNMFFCYKYANR